MRTALEWPARLENLARIGIQTSLLLHFAGQRKNEHSGMTKYSYRRV